MAWRMVEYVCRACGERFESLEADVPKTKRCECSGTGDLVLSAPRFNPRYGWAETRGKSDERPANALDTRPIARRAGVDV